ncbi:MAG: low-complexity protein, partial [Microcystaceae cyanobacterium]
MPTEPDPSPTTPETSNAVTPQRTWAMMSQTLPSTNPWPLVVALGTMGVGLLTSWAWLGFTGAILAFMLSLQVLFPSWQSWFKRYLTPQERQSLLAGLGLILAIAGLGKYLGIYELLTRWLTQFKYDEFGSWAEWVGALGQIMIALLAVYVAWQQYVISKDLTIQQNRIT